VRPSLRWARLVAVIAACLALGVGAYLLAALSWDAVVDYESPYVAAELDTAPAGSAIASRTVLVIVDGLRLDASRRMGTLNSLRGYGADLTLSAPEPSLSYPNWTTILSGAPPYVSGVVTNWHAGPAPPETLFDTAREADVKTVFVGPTDFETLYGVERKTAASFMREWQHEYLSSTYVDQAIRLATEQQPQLIVVHLPDIDEAGHTFGGSSPQYAEVVSRVDGDLSRLVNGLQDGSTVFAIVADHGHIDPGGHGGWESVVTNVPGVFAGPGIPLRTGTGQMQDVAPTLSVLIGAGSPRLSAGLPLEDVVGAWESTWPVFDQADAFWRAYGEIVGITATTVIPPQGTEVRAVEAWARSLEPPRESRERTERLPYAVVGLTLSVLALIVVALVSRPAFLSALAGTTVYYVVYNLMFFVLHDYEWSLSAFNSEDLIQTWLNTRTIEAAIALMAGAITAAFVYPYLRRSPKGPQGEYLAGWLTLGPATALVILATLGLQVAWFVWWWGIDPTWRLPDLMWAFKYDLDLVQATAVGLGALLTPLVTYLVGRYHPKVRTSTSQE